MGVGGGQQPGSRQLAQAAPAIPPEAYGGMGIYGERGGGGGGEGEGASYMQGGGLVPPGMGAPGLVPPTASPTPEDMMNMAMLDPEGQGINFQRGGPVMTNMLARRRYG
jgi:hypothetical protein